MLTQCKTMPHSVESLRKLFFPRHGSYSNVWGWSYNGIQIARVVISSPNRITYYDKNNNKIKSFERTCYLDEE